MRKMPILALSSVTFSVANEPNAAPAPPADAPQAPMTAKSVLEEIKSYNNCLPHGSEDFMAGFTVSLLEKAADSGILSDVRALYLAPRIVLAPLRHERKKHEAQT